MYPKCSAERVKELDQARKELSDLRASFDSVSEERDQAIRQSTRQQSLTSVQQHLNEVKYVMFETSRSSLISYNFCAAS